MPVILTDIKRSCDCQTKAPISTKKRSLLLSGSHEASKCRSCCLRPMMSILMSHNWYAPAAECTAILLLLWGGRREGRRKEDHPGTTGNMHPRHPGNQCVEIKRLFRNKIKIMFFPCLNRYCCSPYLRES